MTTPLRKTNPQTLNYPQISDLEGRISHLDQKIKNMRTFAIGDDWANRINLFGKISAVILGLLGTAYALRTPITNLAITIFRHCK